MDGFFAGMDCRLRVSITDSIMMSILYSAMDKAHEKVKSKEGDIGCLNEITKFYELAIMLLQGCLNFVEEETGDCIPESSQEKMLLDVKEIRDRLRGRLKETEFALSEKDRELAERLENELKLRQALELKEVELISLCTDLEVEKAKSQGLQEFISSNLIHGVENREGEPFQLKNYVDQRAWNIKQNLEEERMNITSWMTKVNQAPSNLVNLQADSGLGYKERSWSVESNEIELFEKTNDSGSEPSNYSIKPELNIGFDQMSLELESLKETLEVTFGKMQNAIFLSEVGTIEQQWRWTIEKDTISILTKGFMRDSRENFEGEMRKCKKQASPFFLSKQWTELMNNVAYLRDDLESLVSQNEAQITSTNHHEGLVPSSQTNTEFNNFQHTRESHFLECKIYDRPDHSSTEVEELGHREKPPEEDPEGEGDRSHLVAKMIKSHESFIRKKCEELNLVKRDVIRDKRMTCYRRDKDLDGPKKRIEEVIVNLKNLIKWNTEFSENFLDCFDAHEEQNFPGKKLSRFDRRDQTVMGIKTLQCVEEKASNNTVSHARDEELQTEIQKLKQCAEDVALQSMIMEATNVILFKELIKEFYVNFYNHDVETLIREGIIQDIFREIVIDWIRNLEGSVAEAQIREEIYYIFFNAAVKDFKCAHDFDLAKNQVAEADANCLEDPASTNMSLHNLECIIREDVYAVLISGIIEEWNMVRESCKYESFLREDINWIVFHETIKGIVSISNFPSSQQKGDNVNFSFSSELSHLETLVKEDVYMVFVKEMIQNWRMEIDAFNTRSLIEDDIYKYVIVEVIKDAYIFSRESEGQNSKKFSEAANKLYGSEVEYGDESLILKLNSLLKYFHIEEDLMRSTSSELKEHCAYIRLVSLQCGWLNWGDLFEELLTKEKIMFSSVISKIEKALQQLIMSKELLTDLGTSLGIAVGDLVKKVHVQMTPIEGIAKDEVHSCPPKENGESESEPSNLTFSYLTGFPQMLADFEDAVNERLGTNALRYLDFGWISAVSQTCHSNFGSDSLGFYFHNTAELILC